MLKKKNNENIKSKLGIVEPAVPVEKALAVWESFQEIKKKLLTKDDYASIGGKQFAKKSGWRKVATVFNLSDEMVSARRTERKDGSFVWRIAVKITAPNGRSTVGLSACDSKERSFAHVEHDVYSTAHTRAKSRAISDLVGGGEVSAEEMGDSPKQTYEQHRNDMKRE